MSKLLNYNGKEYKKKCQSVRAQLSNQGIKYALYERTNSNDQKITICIAKLPSGVNVRGYAICSTEDNFCRAVGNFYAMMRVLRGAKHEQDMEWTENQQVKSGFSQGMNLTFPKVSWNVTLAPDELDLLPLEGNDKEVVRMEEK